MPQPKVIRIILIVRAVLADVRGGLSSQSYLIKSTLSTVHNLSVTESCQCVQLTFPLTRRLTTNLIICFELFLRPNAGG